jgi:hypothetical protein
MRLILHAAACWLTLTVRDEIPYMQPLASSEFSTIRRRLLKIHLWIKATATRNKLAFVANCLDAVLFCGMIGALVQRPTWVLGHNAPVEPCLINPQHLADTIQNMVKPASGSVCAY